MTPAPDDLNDNDAEGRLAAVRTQVIDHAEAARDAATTAIDKAREAATGAYSTTRDKAAELIVTTRDKAGEAYTAARAHAASLGQQAAEGVEANPLAVVIGGVALGAIIGLLSPRSRREIDLLKPIGTRVAGLANDALVAAKGAGTEKLAEFGLTRTGVREKLDQLLDAGKQAATSAGTAAAGAVSKPAE